MIFASKVAREYAMECTRGRYQRALVEGRRQWDRSDLSKVEDRYWWSRAHSQEGLRLRMEARGLHTARVWTEDGRDLVVACTRRGLAGCIRRHGYNTIYNPRWWQ